MTNLNRRSQLITAGVARSPNRAMLRAVGFKDGDFEKSIVGVANGHSTMNPCNAGIQPLVDRVMVALKGWSNGTGLRFPYGNRRYWHGHRRHEVFTGIARSHCRFNRSRGQRARMDGVVASAAATRTCREAMAIARMNVPESSCMPVLSSRAFGREKSSRSSARSRQSVRFLPVKCRRKTLTALKKTLARQWAPVAVSTLQIQCRLRSKRSA